MLLSEPSFLGPNLTLVESDHNTSCIGRCGHGSVTRTTLILKAEAGQVFIYPMWLQLAGTLERVLPEVTGREALIPRCLADQIDVCKVICVG